MEKCPILVFANKIDIASLNLNQIAEKMGLDQLKRVWHLQPCCGLNGEGIVEGF
jgi:hypothetical protein